MSSPLDVNGVIAWLNGTFGLSMPVLPFSAPWLAPFAGLWNLLVPGSLPKPGDPFPWTIPVSGTWTVPVGGTFVLENITIVVAAGPATKGFLARVKRALTRPKTKRKRANPAP